MYTVHIQKGLLETRDIHTSTFKKIEQIEEESARAASAKYRSLCCILLSFIFSSILFNFFINFSRIIRVQFVFFFVLLCVAFFFLSSFSYIFSFSCKKPVWFSQSRQKGNKNTHRKQTSTFTFAFCRAVFPFNDLQYLQYMYYYKEQSIDIV